MEKPFLSGKVAMVCGCAGKRSMGRAIVKRLAEEGANIVALDKYAKPKAIFPDDEDWRGFEDLCAEVTALGREILPVVASVEKYSEVEAAINAAMRKFGKIDILVNTVGIRGTPNVPITDFSEEEWHQVFNTNVLGAFNVSKAVARVMIQRGEGGKIVHIASLAGKIGVAGGSIYAASKWAVIGLVRSLALELAPYKINVYAINPGDVETHLRDHHFKLLSEKTGIPITTLREEHYKNAIRKSPLGRALGRIATVEDIANLVAFLVSDQASFITGVDIDVAGGLFLGDYSMIER